MSDLRIALFDFDGTLCDSASSIIRLTHIACKKADVPLPDEQQIRDNIGEGLFVAGLNYSSGNEEKAQIIFDEYRIAARQELADPEKPVDPLFDGTKQTLEKLSEEGWLIGIVTNKGRHGLKKMLERHNITALIDVSFTADDVTVKPAPDMAIAAINHFGIAPDRAVMIGDTINDALCAKGANIAFVGVDWGYHHNDVLIENGAIYIASDFQDLRVNLNRLVP